MLTPAEAESCPTDEAERLPHLAQLWTAKEALYKAADAGGFDPAAVDTTNQSYKTQTITVDGTSYTLTVATATPQILRVFPDVDLSKF